MRTRPKAGEQYRHFKGNLYEVKGIARHSETGEELVIYEAQYDDHQLYARPMEEFLSPVDREKYPEADQEERFRLLEEQEERFWLMEFLEAETWAEKKEIYLKSKDLMTESQLELCAEAMDQALVPGTPFERSYYQLLNAIEAKERYEKSRR